MANSFFDGIGSMLGSGVGFFSRYWWIVAIILGVVVLVAIIWLLDKMKRKKTQWTHKFQVKRVLQNGNVTAPIIIRARRFPLEKGVEVFELEKPLLGSYLIPQPGEYTDVNTFSIILDSHNRIWNDMGTKFNKDKQSMEVSAVHSGIDVELQAMKEKWQQAHKVQKRISALDLIKAGIKVLWIIALVIISIVALQQWGDYQQSKANVAEAEAQAMMHINDAIQTIEKVVNTQQLQIIPMLKALYGSENIADEINKYRLLENETQS
jgi:uncharacterized membrane protein YeiB